MLYSRILLFQFSVPNGLVVSTIAYKEFIKGDLKSVLDKFEKDIWSSSQDKHAKFCEKVIKAVQAKELPITLKQSITSNLTEIFGDINNLKFAVRSSATGEDTEQMSAAGQMETFLGLKGFEQIFKAVANCWASQFTLQAVEYKRQHGQRLNTPMAVVIQEMVSCDVAGVIFTCDPVSGDQRYVSITANWGLGESVVSASAEPDTIVLKRDINNRVNVHSKLLGKKHKKTIMQGDTGIQEVDIAEEQSSDYCLSEDEALKLGKEAVEIENEYGTPRDIEWGIANGKIYFFQSRPITTLDVDTNFESEHFSDSALRCEKEILSRAHVGEALPGAFSPLGYNIMIVMSDIANEGKPIKFEADSLPPTPYIERGHAIAYYQVFFNLVSSLFSFEVEENDFNKALVVAFFGRLIDDKEIRKMAVKRHSAQSAQKKFSLINFLKPYYLFYMAYFSGMKGRRIIKKWNDYKIPIPNMRSRELLHHVALHVGKVGQVIGVHMDNTFASTHWNSTILQLLAKAEGDWDNLVYSDFAYLLSSCSGVESANVPLAMQELAYVISKSINPTTFKNMKVEEAKLWLETNKGIAGQMYEDFLKRHGHRCITEFDIYSEVWRENPKSLIENIQSLVNDNIKNPKAKNTESFLTVLSNLKIPLNLLSRLKLFWMLPNAQRCVRDREFSKAFYVKMVHCIRIAMNAFSQKLVEEGRIPNRKYLYWMSLYEVSQLCQNRKPSIVTRAGKRWKTFNKVNELKFEEIFSGVPKPINLNEDIPTPKGFLMTGVPVSRGVVTGPVCVAKTIKDAVNIKQGDILIAYSTDIAWSPYFPLLSGVVTELGGLISHGAVVAREYGLPCVVALHGATRMFKTGDVVVLDGNKGTLQKVD